MPVSRVTSLHGVFVGSHAIAEGAATRKQLQSGIYRRLLHNVYADPGLPVDHRLVTRAAALLMPADAVIGGRSAAAWLGAPFASASDPVTVLVPRTSAWRGPRGIRIHRTDLRLGGVQVVEEDIRITDPLRTAWDVASLERMADAVACLDGMLREEALTADAIRRLCAWAPGQWRAQRARKALALADGRADSPPESWVRVALHRAGVAAPVPQHAIVVDGVFLGQVDLGWPEARVAVEYEGPHHFEGLQIVKDDRRYARMEAAGWRVIRLSAPDLRDLDAVVLRIRRALAEGAVVG